MFSFFNELAICQIKKKASFTPIVSAAHDKWFQRLNKTQESIRQFSPEVWLQSARLYLFWKITQINERVLYFVTRFRVWSFIISHFQSTSLPKSTKKKSNSADPSDRLINKTYLHKISLYNVSMQNTRKALKVKVVETAETQSHEWKVFPSPTRLQTAG